MIKNKPFLSSAFKKAREDRTNTNTNNLKVVTTCKVVSGDLRVARQTTYLLLVG
jgi:hypothetical protein